MYSFWQVKIYSNGQLYNKFWTKINACLSSFLSFNGIGPQKYQSGGLTFCMHDEVNKNDTFSIKLT
jgi:hypothetical protein